MVNPQFPHYCKVTRSVDQENPNLPPDNIVVMEGMCQNQLNAAGDTVWKEGVLYSDYTTYLPIEIEGSAQKGDKIEINDNSRIIVGLVAQFERGNLGIRIWSERENERQ